MCIPLLYLCIIMLCINYSQKSNLAVTFMNWNTVLDQRHYLQVLTCLQSCSIQGLTALWTALLHHSLFFVFLILNICHETVTDGIGIMAYTDGIMLIVSML